MDRISPMLATAAPLPTPSDDGNWAYETKWDGVRIIAYLDGDSVMLRSRNDLDVTVSYPELRGLGAQVGASEAVLDGEVVAFDSDGRPSFARLQKRMHVRSAVDAQRLAVSDPAVYLVFDLLRLDGRSTASLSFTDRRALLDGLELSGPAWKVPPYFVGGGADVLAASKEHGLEGVVAKRLTSTYRPGKRSADWRKIKNFRTQEVVIGGWREGNGRRQGTVGALMMGIPTDAGLRYVGNVGTGFTDAVLADLHTRLTSLARTTSPFDAVLPAVESKGAQWVRPQLVGEVEFGEWTPDERLRHPAWRGLRPDKSAADVVRER